MSSKTQTPKTLWHGLAVAILVVAASGCGSRWSAPEPLGDAGPGAPMGTNFVDRVGLAVSMGGRAVLAWEKRTPDSTEILAREFAPGRGWGSEERSSLVLPRATLSVPAIDAAGNAILTWTAYDDAESQFRFETRRLRAGAGWESPETLAVTTRGGSVLAGMNERGDAAIVWPEQSRLFVRIDAGGARGTPELIDEVETGPGNTENPAGIGLDESGRVIVVWKQQFLTVPHGAAALLARRFTPGSGWGERTVRSGGWGVDTSNLAVNGAGEALMLWESFVAVSTGVSADRFRPSVGWQAEALAPSRFVITRVGLDARGNGWTVFPVPAADPNKPPNRVMAQRLDAASGWQPAETISGPGSSEVREPDLAVSGSGLAVALWTEVRGSRQALMASSSTGAGWGPPEMLVDREARACGESRGRSGVHGPRVALDGSGNAVAAWIEWDCSRATVWSSRLDAASVVMR